MLHFFIAFFGLLLALPAAADDALRPSAQLMFRQPEMLRAGSCVRYQEGGRGWLITDPVFYLRGRVVSAEIRTRQLTTCPEVRGKRQPQYTREEFNQLALAYPCLARGEMPQTVQLGIVRLVVDAWETPHARTMASAGRLYRGMYIDTRLQSGLEIELEADLLEACHP